MFLPVVNRAGAGNRAVALTFDDGPTPGGTDRVLDVLREHRVPAAFFVIGSNVCRFPDLVRRMHDEGHLIGNHTFDHRPLCALRPPSHWRQQLTSTDDAVESAIGLRPALFRAPWGHKSPWMRTPLRECGKTPIGWTRRAFDGVAVSAESVVRRLGSAGPGEVLLLHDGRPARSKRDPAPTVDALPRVIEAIQASGLTIERLDRMLGLEPYLAARTCAASSGGTSRSGAGAAGHRG